MADKKRIGVFICGCGGNISKTVDVESLKSEVEKFQDVAYVEGAQFTCSKLNLESIKSKIAEKELDSGVLPISVNRPMPSRKEEGLDSVKIEETTFSDAQKIAVEKETAKEIVESGDMMNLADSVEESEIDESIVVETKERLE